MSSFSCYTGEGVGIDRIKLVILIKSKIPMLRIAATQFDCACTTLRCEPPNDASIIRGTPAAVDDALLNRLRITLDLT